MIKEIIIPEELRDRVQKANVERDARRDILLYIMQNNITIPEERITRYQQEYNNKFFEFEQLKTIIEKDYVKPMTHGRALNWSLDYATCVVSITLPDE